MPRFAIILSGLVLLVSGILLSMSSVAAQEPPPAPTSRTLVSQRVEQLPPAPWCWNIAYDTRPAGARAPATNDYHAEPLTVAYMIQGSQTVEYAGGPTRTYGEGAGLFVGENNWHAHVIGNTSPFKSLVFELTCQPRSRGGAITQIGNTGPLPGVQPDKGPHILQLTEVRWAVGAQIPPSSTAGPRTFFILEGEFTIAMPEGLRHLGPGETITVPPGTPYQTTNVGAAPALLLNLQITPVGETSARIPTDVQLINPLASAAPAALPRAGDSISWVGYVLSFVGILLIVGGITLRRVRP